MATEATVAIEAIEAIQAWGASWRSRRVQTLLVRFLLAPLEFPKLANAQPSNFGPLRMLVKSDVMLGYSEVRLGKS